ncbi:SLAM family member 5-like isoform 2-T3 [Synchiropus picturatus]
MHHYRPLLLQVLLMFWHCLYDVATFTCPEVHKMVGDTVLLQSRRVQTEKIEEAYWKHYDTRIINKDKTYKVPPQFSGRIELNQNLSLTVRNLRVQDTGVFSFVLQQERSQPPTIQISLQVHEKIAEPTLTQNITWLQWNSSCMVWLGCSSRSNVSINSTVGNFSRGGGRLQRVILPEDGDVKLTCTAFNPVSQKSVSASVRCKNDTASSQLETAQVDMMIPVIVAGCSTVILVVVTVTVSVHRCKKQQAGNKEHENLTEYAVIHEPQEVRAADAEEMTFYETIHDVGNSVRTGPQTVYDEVHFGRPRVDSTSPYQEVA